jgi:Rps23 Pro-64 3,4-dihydroxylase Tpa1-like proline 4-hydroxylase
MIRPDLLNQTEELRRAFTTADPFPHLTLDDFLEPGACQALMEQFPAFNPAQARGDSGAVGRKAAFPKMTELGPAYAAFDRWIQSSEFLDWLSRATGIPKLLYDPEYVGGGAHLNLEGQELDAHVDFNYHPRTQLHRRLNLILYLNPEWDEAWGGSLELHSDPRSPGNRVELAPPLVNRCVIFETSERSWHGFPVIRLPEGKKHLARRSIAVYFYTKERPLAQTAPSHATFYIGRPMPEHVRPGYTMTEEDIQAIQVLLARRDGMIDLLYKREMEFSSQLSWYAQIRESRSFQFARWLTAPMRRLRRVLALAAGPWRA